MSTVTVPEPDVVAFESNSDIAPIVAIGAIGSVVSAASSVLNTALNAVNTGINLANITGSTSDNRQIQVIELRNHSRPRQDGDKSPYNPGVVLYLTSFKTSYCVMLETFVLLRPGESDTLTLVANDNASSSVTISGVIVDMQNGKQVQDSFKMTIQFDNNDDTGWYAQGGDIWDTGHATLKNTKANLYFLGSESQGGASCFEIVPDLVLND